MSEMKINNKLETIVSSAKGKNIMITPRKMKLAADFIRNKTVHQSVMSLKFYRKKACGFLLKVLNSAIANAKQKGEIINDLVVGIINVGPGLTLRRVMFRGRGKADTIEKRASNIEIKLVRRTEKVEVKNG
jgi:large subunit ribosomal protein L22